MSNNDEDEIKPVTAGDDFSDDTQQEDTNPVDAELDAGVDPIEDDLDDETIDTDTPSDNPLATESAMDDVDDKVLPEEKQNLGDTIYNPLENEEEDSEE